MRKYIQISLLFCTLFSATISFASQIEKVIPIDAKVRIGVLDNGLTYYIRANSLPENRADFYIAQKVGSIQEKPEQRGLAHFLEHMAFNGTTHFSGNEKELGVIDWCETIGVKFGTNINAYTSVDETVYNISNVPMIRDGILDSCLLILHDWANDLLLEDVEIDKERKVIEEEWRTRDGAGQRFWEKASVKMYEGTKYEDCLPIGSMEVVRNFDYEVLRDYYETWYRPDLQGVIVVGDVDVDSVEQKIKSLFSDIELPKEVEERIYFPVADNDEPIVFIDKDKEQTNVQFLLFNKHDAISDSLKNRESYLSEMYLESMATSMLNSRLAELIQDVDPPFMISSTSISDYFLSKTKGAFTGYVICKEDSILNGISVFMEELERARRFGFSQSEYERAESNFLSMIESAFQSRNKMENGSYIREYVRHFLDAEPTPGIEYEYSYYKELTPTISVRDVNKMFAELLSDDNWVLTLFGPDKESINYPTSKELLSIFEEVDSKELSPYVDNVVDKPLISENLKGSRIVSEKTEGIFGTTELQLSNGIKILVKSTDFQADQILMNGSSFGGTSLMPNSERLSFTIMNEVVGLGGVGEFSVIDLGKVLAGKRAVASAFVSDKQELVNGQCVPKDLETMLQLAYLNITAPRIDSVAFESYKVRKKMALKNKAMNPSSSFRDSIMTAIYPDNPRQLILKEADIDNIDYLRVVELYRERFSDSGDFVFSFVGNIDLETAKPLFEKYLGSLPVTNRKESFRDNKIYPRQGIFTNEYATKLETPKSSVFLYYNGDCRYKLKNKLLISTLTQLLNFVYTEKIREEAGGTYGVRVSGKLSKYPKESYSLQISFDTAPEKKEELMVIVFDEIENICNTDVSDSELQKVKEYMLKSYMEQQKRNGYWSSLIQSYIYTGADNRINYEEILQNITVEELRKFAKRLFDQDNRVEVTMTEKTKPLTE